MDRAEDLSPSPSTSHSFAMPLSTQRQLMHISLCEWSSCSGSGDDQVDSTFRSDLSPPSLVFLSLITLMVALVDICLAM